MIPNWNKILKEWSYRVGVIKPNNNEHLYHLNNILEERGWPHEVINGVINNLTEAEDDKYVSIGYGRYKEKGKEKDSDADVFVKTDAGKYVKSSDQKSDDKGEKPKQVGKPLGKGDFDRDAKQPTPSKDFQRDMGSDEKEKENTNEKSQKSHIDKGFVKGAAPGNAGSMYNEIMSGKVADLIRENPDASDEELVKMLLEDYGDTKLGKQQDSKTIAGGLRKGDLPDIEGVSNGKLSKTVIAVRSGRRKAERASQATKDLGWENTKSEEFFGDKIGLEEQRNRVRNSSKIVNLDGEEISQQEMLELIDSSGSGENPSDTATIIENDEGVITVLFTSDKDSLDAIISQSSAKAESTQTDDAILDLVDDNQLTQEDAEAIAGERRIFASKKEDTERELKEVTNKPSDFLLNEVSNEMIEKAKTATNTKKHFQNEVLNRFKPGGKIQSTPLFDDGGNRIKGGQSHNPEEYLKQVGWKDGEEPTEEQQFKAFLLFSKNAENPPANTQKLVERMNEQNDGPDISIDIEDIRKRVISDEQEHIDFLNERQIEVEGRKVGLGDYIEGNNVWKQGHFDAIGGQKGVHKHRGMFEVNNAGQTITGDTLKKVFEVDTKNEFLSRFEVMEAAEQTGVSGSQKGKVTGSTRIVYAIFIDEAGKEKRLPIMEKRQRSKDGKLGKLQTVYKWTKDFQQKVKENQ